MLVSEFEFKSEFVKFEFVKFEFVKFEFVKFEFVKLEFVKLEFFKLEFVKFESGFAIGGGNKFKFSFIKSVKFTFRRSCSASS